MTASKTLNIALVGNPNSGKSTLFNSLTGLNQKVGNFPGVTVDKKTGKVELDSNHCQHY
jgi:ferrous iron transport protein B